MTKAEEKKSNVIKETEEAVKTAEENAALTTIPEEAKESWWKKQSKGVKGAIIGGAVLLGTGIVAVGKAIWDAVRKDDDDDEIDGTDLGKVDE